MGRILDNRGSLTLFADTLSKDEQVYETDLPDYVGFKSNRLDAQVENLLGSDKDLISKGQALHVDGTKKRDQIIPRTGSELILFIRVKMALYLVSSNRLVILE